MDIIRKGMGITRTIKNVGRLREILSVFARHGFDEFIIKSKLNSVIPNFVLPKSRFKKVEDQIEFDFWQSVGFRLRKSFEELGPSFIKMGQLLATREDLFDDQLIKELKLLQSKVAPIAFSKISQNVELELGKKINELFEYVDETPIGVASIGLVYKAKLITGENVVVKVRRPNIRKSLLSDFELIAFIVLQLEKVSTDIKFLGLSKAINDFFKSIQLELNFLIEANNGQRIGASLEKIDKDNIFVLPKIYKEFCTQKILVMDFLDGVPFNEISNIHKYPELEKNLQTGVKLFLHNMLADGFFHADLHGGNFFKLEDNKIGLIDFGLVGSLSKKNKTNLIAILYALTTNNYENLVYEFLDVAEYEVIPDQDELVRDLRDALLPYIGLTVQQTDAAALTHSIVSTLGKHQIYLPREWFIIFRALITLDGVGKSLGIDLDIFELIESEITTIMGEIVSKEALVEDAIWLGRDVLSSFRIIPRHMKWVLKEFSKKKYTIDVKLVEINQQLNLISKSLNFLGLMILTSTFFACGIFVIGDIRVTKLSEIPIVSYICWGLAALTFMRGYIHGFSK